MADQSDVETALVAAVGAALYPAGTAGGSVLGAVCRVYRGFPAAKALAADLAAGVINVTVFPERRRQAVTTRWIDTEIPQALAVPTLTVSVSGDTASFAGTAGPGQVAGLLADGVAVVHRGTDGDTPERVAAILAGYLSTQRIALADGATVAVPGAGSLIARVVADQAGLSETRRQRQPFRISCWCADPATRDATAGAIDQALSATAFLPLADGTAGRLRLLTSTVFDQSENAALYRRDLLFSVDYATTIAATLPAMIFGAAALSPNGAQAGVSLS